MASKSSSARDSRGKNDPYQPEWLTSRIGRRAIVVAILLLAFFLRSWLLTVVPPGLTHDEANHGREAIGILQGNLALFFPLNYGSEPLYSYTVAALMALIGRGLLALRLVNVFFGMLAISATYLFGRLAFGRLAGVLAAALMAISFWPLAASREALRAGMMPFFAAGAMIALWLMVQEARKTTAADARPEDTGPRIWLFAAILTVCLSATLYNYLAARVLWLVVPLFLGYLALLHRHLARRLWLPIVVALVLTGLSIVPMFVYLQQNPEAQTRLQMFGVLQELQQGQVLPLMQTAGKALLAFFWPGAGDRFLAYNLPGRPTLTSLTAFFFLSGVAISVWRWRTRSYALLLLWFLTGIIPSLLTGATANTTRNAGAMPALFLLSAVGFDGLLRWLGPRLYARGKGTQHQRRWLPALFLAGWLALTVYTVSGDYFRRWARAPEVRAAYMQTLRRQMAYVRARPGPEATVISSELPGPAHNQSIGLVLLPDADNLRWVDARSALVLPAEAGARFLIPSSTPLHPTFVPWLTPEETVRLRSDDLDPWFIVYHLAEMPQLPQDGAPATFGQSQQQAALALLGSEWLTPQPQAGEEAELLLVWRVEDAASVGPYHGAINGTDVVFFTHVLDDRGEIVAQDDRLDAPSTSWRTGDLVVQIHRLQLPEPLPAATYTTVSGVYDRESQAPLVVLGEARRWDGTRAIVDSLNIIP